MGANGPVDDKKDESRLIELAKAGSREAFETLMNRHRKEIYNLSYRISGNHHDADDIAQNTFIKVYFSLKTFRGESSLKTWITMIALNTAKSFLAKHRRRERRELPIKEEVTAGSAESAISDAALNAKGIVARAMKNMPDRQKEVLILKFYHGMKHGEIAQALGITTGAAKANLFHAVKYLKSKIDT